MTAERVVDADKLIDAEELPDAKGLTDGLDTAGLKTTIAKITPEASLRLCVSNRLSGLHDEVFSSKEAATQFFCAEHWARHPKRAEETPDRLVAWRLRRLLIAMPS